MSYMTAIVL